MADTARHGLKKHNTNQRDQTITANANLDILDADIPTAAELAALASIASILTRLTAMERRTGTAVGSIALLQAVAAIDRYDQQVRFCEETNFQYYFDAQATSSGSNIKPNDLGSGVPGRWEKIYGVAP